MWQRRLPASGDQSGSYRLTSDSDTANLRSACRFAGSREYASRVEMLRCLREESRAEVQAVLPSVLNRAFVGEMFEAKQTPGEPLLRHAELAVNMAGSVLPSCWRSEGTMGSEEGTVK